MIRVGSDAASWAKTLEQGLALDEPVGRPASSARHRMKTSLKREAQGESGGHQSPPAAGAAWRGAVPHHRRNSPMVGAWLHAGRVRFLRKLGSTAAAEVVRREHDRRQEFGGRLTQPIPGEAGRNAVPPSSQRYNGDSWGREGGVFAPTLSPAWTSFAGGRRCGTRRLGERTTVGTVRTGLGQGSSNRRTNS